MSGSADATPTPAVNDNIRTPTAAASLVNDIGAFPLTTPNAETDAISYGTRHLPTEQLSKPNFLVVARHGHGTARQRLTQLVSTNRLCDLDGAADFFRRRSCRVAECPQPGAQNVNHRNHGEHNHVATYAVRAASEIRHRRTKRKCTMITAPNQPQPLQLCARCARQRRTNNECRPPDVRMGDPGHRGLRALGPPTRVGSACSPRPRPPEPHRPPVPRAALWRHGISPDRIMPRARNHLIALWIAGSTGATT